MELRTLEADRELPSLERDKLAMTLTALPIEQKKRRARSRNHDRVDPVDEDDSQPRLRLDIHFNFEGLGGLDGPLAGLSQFATVEGHVPSEQKLVELSCTLYDSRRLRTRFINNNLLGEPVWDMLLALYCFSGRGEALSVSGLCHAAGVPQTTALRWVKLMEQKKLVKRSKDSKDGRRAYVSLTDDSKKLLENYFATIQESKPPAGTFCGLTSTS